MKQTRTKAEQRAARKRNNRVAQATKKANIRAKYGPSMKPSPVTVRYVGSEHQYEVDQRQLRRSYAPLLDQMAAAAGYCDYASYLRSPHWKHIRQEVLDRDGHRCVRCRGTEQLSVHHESYAHIGQEIADKLVTFCWSCHCKIHPRPA